MAETIQSVDRALEVLIYLEAADQETSITKMASDMGVYKSTIYRTLATLEARGFVRKNPDTDRYWLGNRLFSLGKSVENHLGIQEVVRPSARKLYEAYHETVNVAILERDHDEVYRSVIVLKEEGGHQMLTVNLPVGASVECHSTSGGKCLLAFGRNIDLSVYEKRPLHAYTDRTITSARSSVAEVEQVRRQGYAMDRDEMEHGLTCIGVPILREDGTALAAISLSGPTSRMLSGDLDERVEAVKRIAREIAARF